MGNCLVVRKGGDAEFKEMAVLTRFDSVFFGIFGENNYFSNATTSTLTGDYLQIKNGTLYILKNGEYRVSKFNYSGTTGTSETITYSMGDTIARDTTTQNSLIVEAL